jgi:hypothetical protein
MSSIFYTLDKDVFGFVICLPNSYFPGRLALVPSAPCHPHLHSLDPEHRASDDLSVPDGFRARPGRGPDEGLRTGGESIPHRRGNPVSVPVHRTARTQVRHVARRGAGDRGHGTRRLVAQSRQSRRGALLAPTLYALGFSFVTAAAVVINLLGLAAVWYVSRHHK